MKGSFYCSALPQAWELQGVPLNHLFPPARFLHATGPAGYNNTQLPFLLNFKTHSFTNLPPEPLLLSPSKLLPSVIVFFLKHEFSVEWISGAKLPALMGCAMSGGVIFLYSILLCILVDRTGLAAGYGHCSGSKQTTTPLSDVSNQNHLASRQKSAAHLPPKFPLNSASQPFDENCYSLSHSKAKSGNIHVTVL
ncbi:hypothetical protein ACET3Z_012264 [Daucus carota]